MHGALFRLARRNQALWIRSAMMQAIRTFFTKRGYLEVETPILLASVAPETHIDAIRVQERFLQTSPELCMKQLLAAGFPKIFQIARCFRQAERGGRHLPEFTLLEWYRANQDYEGLMEECEALIQQVAGALGKEGTVSWGGEDVDLEGPWPRISVREAFGRYGRIGLEEALGRDLFDLVLVEDVEPNLGREQPVFLCDYPASMAALSRLKAGEMALAERFELYLAGMELANGFSELTDAREQRERFERENAERVGQGKTPYPMPERFLEALPYMPEAAGIALGVDRLAMLLLQARTIDEVVSFTPEEA